MIKYRKFFLIFIFLLFFLEFGEIQQVYALSDSKQEICYQTHIERIGWQNEVNNGEVAGTTGRYLRMEAIKINNKNSNFKIYYQVHVEKIGWQDRVEQGNIAGTMGQSLRMEAIKIEIENTTEVQYNIEYRVHVEGIGWQEWRHNGEIAGTTGKCLRMEAIEIRIKENKDLGVAYISHIQNIGWDESYKYNGETSGTTGQCLRNEALKIQLVNKTLENAGIRYNAYIENLGWSGWKENGDIAGTTGQCLRLESIQIELINLKNYSVIYRVHIEKKGWTNWEKDGIKIGNENSGLRIEAIEIRIVNKNEYTIIEEQNCSVKKGIDVSVYQGNIDWKKVSNDGYVDFAMIRAGFRGYGSNGTLVTDSKFKNNIEGALSNGIDVGVYFFSQAINELEAIEEANYILNLIKGYNITYPIAIDTEDVPNVVGRADNLSKEQRTEVVLTFCKRIKESRV